MTPRLPLVLLPGLMCDAAAWAPQMAALGRSATVVDYGDADAIEAMAEAALAVAPPGRFALAGHSMGGRVAFEVHRRAAGRVDRLALLDTGCAPLAAGAAGATERAGRLALLDLAQLDGVRTMARQWAAGMLHPSRLGGPVFEAVLEMFDRRSAARFGQQVQALLNRPDATPELARIDCPTLLLTGSHDAWSNAAQHEAMQARIAGATLVVVPDCGHMTTIEDPAAVNAALARWLAA